VFCIQGKLQGIGVYFFMIRYPQGIQREENNGTIRRNGKADEGRTGKDAGQGRITPQRI
jgi:hypothetical protein